MQNAIAYYRVSTARQGESGLGLEAQQTTVHQFTKMKGITLIKEFTEIESGKKNNRPILLKALESCKKNKATLIIAKLNRLGRNVAFISALMESGVDFIATDMPEASRFVLHILAAVAEYQRDEISNTTRLALQAAKKNGVKLGKHGPALAKLNKERSKKFTRATRPIIVALHNEGFCTLEAISKELNRRKIPTYRKGAKWHNSTVHAILVKLGIR